MKATNVLEVVHDRERRALLALIEVYGDNVETILNGLHAMSARIAIASGVTPEKFAAGMKHHWDFLVEHLNSDAPSN
jgi:hypothetical protein